MGSLLTIPFRESLHALINNVDTELAEFVRERLLNFFRGLEKEHAAEIISTLYHEEMFSEDKKWPVSDEQWCFAIFFGLKKDKYIKGKHDVKWYEKAQKQIKHGRECRGEPVNYDKSRAEKGEIYKIDPKNPWYRYSTLPFKPTEFLPLEQYRKKSLLGGSGEDRDMASVIAEKRKVKRAELKAKRKQREKLEKQRRAEERRQREEDMALAQAQVGGAAGIPGAGSGAASIGAVELKRDKKEVLDEDDSSGDEEEDEDEEDDAEDGSDGDKDGEGSKHKSDICLPVLIPRPPPSSANRDKPVAIPEIASTIQTELKKSEQLIQDIVPAWRPYSHYKTVMKTFEQEEDIECSICLDDFELSEVCVTSCAHVFCEGCLKQQMTIRRECPMCRAPLQDKDCYPLIGQVDIFKNRKKNKFGQKKQKSIFNGGLGGVGGEGGVACASSGRGGAAASSSAAPVAGTGMKAAGEKEKIMDGSKKKDGYASDDEEVEEDVLTDEEDVLGFVSAKDAQKVEVKEDTDIRMDEGMRLLKEKMDALQKKREETEALNKKRRHAEYGTKIGACIELINKIQSEEPGACVLVYCQSEVRRTSVVSEGVHKKHNIFLDIFLSISISIYFLPKSDSEEKNRPRVLLRKIPLS